MSETIAASAAIPALHDPSLYTNRELSWLEFNQRVLDQAVADYDPLLERVKFLAIVGSNLDEFFMVRVATLQKRHRAGLEQVSPDGLTVTEQLTAIRERATTMLKDQAVCWAERLRPELAATGIRFLEIEEYTPTAPTNYPASATPRSRGGTAGLQARSNICWSGIRHAPSRKASKRKDQAARRM